MQRHPYFNIGFWCVVIVNLLATASVWAGTPSETMKREQLKSVAREISKEVGKGVIELAREGRGFDSGNRTGLRPENKSRRSEPRLDTLVQNLIRRNSRF